MIQAQRFSELISLQIKYEDLVKTPNDVQSRISRTTGLQSQTVFSEYPKFVDSQVFEEPEYREYEPYRPRSIDQRSIGHSSNEYIELCTSTREREMFERVLRRMGYLGEEVQKPWDLSEVCAEQALFEELSKQMGYDCA